LFKRLSRACVKPKQECPLFAKVKCLRKDPGSRERSTEHKWIYELYETIQDPNKFQYAAENLRV
jgi:hypothetical protein